MWFDRLLKLEPAERPAVIWAFAYFFCLLSAYYILRPVRDAMGIVGGIENLQWLFSATFVVMLMAVPLYGWATRHYPRHRLLPLVYGFFILNLLTFYWLFTQQLSPEWTARSFFVWISVFNLFVVSVFWSFMSDLFKQAQAKRLFGLIATGGSAGAIAGPTLTALLATSLGTASLILISASLLFIAILCIHRLVIWSDNNTQHSTQHANDDALGGHVLAGFKLLLRSPYLMGIASYILLYTCLATFLYFEQAHIIKNAFETSEQRTQVFALIDLTVNALTILIQLFITSRLVDRFGLSLTLALIPVLMALGFIMLGISPVLLVLVIFQVVRRAGNYAIAKPAREMLFTVLSREEKYKAKNVIDTVVYRGGDAISGWLFAGLMAMGTGLTGIAFIGAVFALLWAANGWWLGKQNRQA
ncbi:MAG: MFS transporter [Gammaproteobacteria bacterium]|nr:MFS transporter [Gammaproteobacteria bacterium]